MRTNTHNWKIWMAPAAATLMMGLLVLVPRVAQATTWTVGVGPTYNFATISAAVAHASVQNGDTLEVAPGTYTEGNITIGKSLTIKGANAGKAGTDPSRGAETIWASTAQGVGPTISAANVVIDGFTLKLLKNMGTNFGGVRIVNNIFDTTKPNAAAGSGYIFTLSHAGAMNGFTFSDNWVKSTTTATAIVAMDGAANRTVNNLVFTGNKVDYCGAGQGYCIFLNDPGKSPVPTFNGLTIQNNTVLGGAIRVFNITSAASYKISGNTLEAIYYSIMIGGNDGEIYNNTFLPGPASASNSCSPMIFALSIFNANVKLEDVSFHDNTVFFANKLASSYGILFSTGGGTVILDILKTLPGLVDGFTARDNNFVYAGAANDIHWAMQSSISNSFASAQKVIELEKNNFFWGAKGSAPSAWRRMRWSEVYVRGTFVHYDWKVTFDANGGYFDATQDMSQWNYDSGTPYGLGPAASSNIGYARNGWVFDGLDPADRTKASKGIARVLNDGAKGTGKQLPFAAPDGSALGGSIDAGNDSVNNAYGAIPTPENKQAAFAGWYTDKACTQRWNPQTYYAAGDVTLYASWLTEKSPLPQTGDSTPPLGLLSAVMLLALCGAVALMLSMRRASA